VHSSLAKALPIDGLSTEERVMPRNKERSLIPAIDTWSQSPASPTAISPTEQRAHIAFLHQRSINDVLRAWDLMHKNKPTLKAMKDAAHALIREDEIQGLKAGGAPLKRFQADVFARARVLTAHDLIRHELTDTSASDERSFTMTQSIAAYEQLLSGQKATKKEAVLEDAGKKLGAVIATLNFLDEKLNTYEDFIEKHSEAALGQGNNGLQEFCRWCVSQRASMSRSVEEHRVRYSAVCAGFHRLAENPVQHLDPIANKYTHTS